MSRYDHGPHALLQPHCHPWGCYSISPGRGFQGGGTLALAIRALPASLQLEGGSQEEPEAGATSLLPVLPSQKLSSADTTTLATTSCM